MRFKGIYDEDKILPVVKHLTKSERNLFFSIYANHSRAMGFEERKKHSLSHVIKVESKPEERCLHVHFDNGNWWHYHVNGTWY